MFTLVPWRSSVLFHLAVLLAVPHQSCSSGSALDETYTLVNDGFSSDVRRSDIRVKREGEDINDAGDGLPVLNQQPEYINATHKIIDLQYYYQETITGHLDAYMVNIPEKLAGLDKKQQEDLKIIGSAKHPHLTDTYRRAFNHRIEFFEFPYYGFNRQNITLATGGFLYVGDTSHHWLAATQYIAPLMANFDTSAHPNSTILYLNTEDMVVVQWDQVFLRDQENRGNFSFQVILEKNGDITFVYIHIPMNVSEVDDESHPRRVGLTDAFVVEPGIGISSMNRRIIYEYHRVSVNLTDVKTGTVIHFKARPTCNSFPTCSQCTHSKLTNFNCTWCRVDEEYGDSFCSDEFGTNRRRQHFRRSQCHRQRTDHYCIGGEEETLSTTVAPEPTPGVTAIEELTSEPPATQRPVTPESSTPEQGTREQTTTGSSSSSAPVTPVPGTKTTAAPVKKVKAETAASTSAISGISAGGVVGILLVLTLVLVLVGWGVYAYLNPHTPSGQFLIQYRPSRWRWPGEHGDVRYTASVHM